MAEDANWARSRPRFGRSSTCASHLTLARSTLLLAFAWTKAVCGETNSQAKAAAEAQFDEGLALMKTGNLPAACAKLESSQRVEPAIGTLLYLGECYARVGRSASAWATFREAASLASAANQLDRARQARLRATDLEPKLAYVKIVVPEAVLHLAGLSVLRDGDALDLSLLGTKLPVDPGSIRVEVRAPGYAPYVSTAEIAPASHTDVDVPALVAAASEPNKTPAERGSPELLPIHNGALSTSPRGDTVQGNPGTNQRTLGIVVGSVGLVGIGFGTYFGLSAMSKNSDAESASCTAQVCQRAADLEKANAARRAASVSNVAFATGGVAVATGLLIYWLAPRTAKAGWTARSQVEQHAFALAIQGPL